MKTADARTALTAIALALVGTSAASATPVALPGWPVRAPAGSVHVGPSAGSAVVIGTTGDTYVVVAPRAH
jgi:hypothetical protein